METGLQPRPRCIPNDQQRIDQLEAEVKDLKARLCKLETWMVAQAAVASGLTVDCHDDGSGPDT